MSSRGSSVPLWMVSGFLHGSKQQNTRAGASSEEQMLLPAPGSTPHIAHRLHRGGKAGKEGRSGVGREGHIQKTSAKKTGKDGKEHKRAKAHCDLPLLCDELFP